MPRPLGEPRTVQVLLRLTAPEHDVLASVAHLEEQTPSGYLYELVRSHLLAVADDEHVQADLANRVAYRARRAAVSRLPGRSASRMPVGDEAGMEDSGGAG